MIRSGQRTDLLGEQYNRIGVSVSSCRWHDYDAAHLTQDPADSSRGCILILDEIVAEVASQLDQQAGMGVRIAQQDDVPDTGPARGGLWLQIPEATAVFADLKGSTKLNTQDGAKAAANAYTYFTRAMAVIMDGFQARYVDVQGDAIFGLFSGKGSRFLAAACAITMKTQVETVVAERFRRDTSAGWYLAAGIGVDRGTLLVRQLGLRGTGMNEVWASTPVNVAAKLSGLAGPNEVVISERVFSDYEKSAKIRQRALLWDCGCRNGAKGRGLDQRPGDARPLWKKTRAPGNLGLDFDYIHRLNQPWCPAHGPEFCEVVVTRNRRNG